MSRTNKIALKFKDSKKTSEMISKIPAKPSKSANFDFFQNSVLIRRVEINEEGTIVHIFKIIEKDKEMSIYLEKGDKLDNWTLTETSEKGCTFEKDEKKKFFPLSK